MNAIAARQAARRQPLLQGIARHAVLIGIGFVFVSPFVFVIFTALMTRDQALTRAVWPSPFRFHNFYDVISQQPLLRWTWNTFLVSFLSSIGTVLSCAPPAYALARMRFRGRNAVFLLVLSTMMLPVQVTIIPLYVLFSHLGWIGSLKPLIVPGFFGDAFSIFLLRQFFMTIPARSPMPRASTVRARSGCCCASSCRSPSRRSWPSSCSTSSTAGTTSSRRRSTSAPTRPPTPCRSASRSSARARRRLRADDGRLRALHAARALLFFLAQRAFVEGVTVTGVKG